MDNEEGLINKDCLYCLQWLIGSCSGVGISFVKCASFVYWGNKNGKKA